MPRTRHGIIFVGNHAVRGCGSNFFRQSRLPTVPERTPIPIGQDFFQKSFIFFPNPKFVPGPGGKSVHLGKDPVLGIFRKERCRLGLACLVAYDQLSLLDANIHLRKDRSKDFRPSDYGRVPFVRPMDASGDQRSLDVHLALGFPDFLRQFFHGCEHSGLLGSKPKRAFPDP